MRLELFNAALFVTVLATRIFASPVTRTISLTKLRRTGSYLKGSPTANRARAAFLKDPGKPTTVPAINLEYITYITSVGIGYPPTYYNLIVDTGSSITFCGSGKRYVRTSTSIPTGETVHDTYGSGNFSGVEYLDQVTLAPDLVITNQSISDALSYHGFEGVDGILGIGPASLTLHKVSPDTNAVIPTVLDNLVSLGLIKNKVVGIHFAPAMTKSDANGALTYGGTDSSKYVGKLQYAPVTKSYPSSAYLGIDVTSWTYGDNQIISTSTAGIVDTGTTQIMLADNFFQSYIDAIPGAKWDSDLGLLEIPPYSALSLKPLKLMIAGQTITLDRVAQLIPPGENPSWGGDDGKTYGVIGKMGGLSGYGLDFILGLAFIERYYVVFDADAQRLGFAETSDTFS